MKIYELVDGPNDEQYFTLGLFLELGEAIRVATDGTAPPTDCFEDVVNLEVRERAIGFTGCYDTGRVVAEIHWEQNYNDDTDDNKWVFKINGEGTK